MRKSTIVLLAALAASAGSASWLWQQLRAERAANIALRARLAALEHRPEPVANRAPATVPAPPESEPTPRANQIVAESPPASAALNHQNDYMARQRELMKIPEYRKALRDAQREQIEGSFRELPRLLELTPEQAAAVFDLMADQAIRDIDLGAQRTASEENGRNYARAIDEQRRKDDAELQRLLGAEKMSRLQEFRDTFASRAEVNTLRNEIGSGPDALRDDQFESMLGIVSEEQQRMNRDLQDLYATAPAGSTRSTLDPSRTELAVAANRRIVESAKSILTPAQLTAVENLYRRQRLQMETRDTMLRLQTETKAREARATDGN